MSEFWIGSAATWEGAALADPDLPPGAKYVILTLAQYTSPMGNMAWPGKHELQRLMGINGNQLTKALKEAREAGYLRYHRTVDGEEGAYLPELPAGRQSITPGLKTSGVTYTMREYDDPEKMVNEIRAALLLDEAVIAAQEKESGIHEEQREAEKPKKRW